VTEAEQCLKRFQHNAKYDRHAAKDLSRIIGIVKTNTDGKTLIPVIP